MLNKHNLAVADFAGKDGRTSPHVRITPTETIATNGHYLVRVSAIPETPAQPTDCSFQVDADALKAIKVKKGDSVELSPNGTGETWNITTGTTSFHVKQESAQFPNVDAIMPKDEPTQVFGLKAEYLAKLAKAFAQFQPEAREPIVKVSVWSPERAIRLEATNDQGQTMTALLMPMRLK
jgi:DNA polymerase III sliding clamp (beta) subunit (PCNA family)